MKEYNGLEYNDDYTKCIKIKNKKLEVVELHPNTKIIGTHAFANTNIKEVILNEGLETINDRAFYDCELLEKINFPASLKEIKEDAFCYTELKTIDLSKCDKLTVLKDCAFYHCTEATNLILPPKIKYIPIQCFKFANFETIDFPDSLEVIDKEAFRSCERLKLFNTKNVKIIESSAFAECIRLKEIIFNESLKEIDSHAFSYCISLTEANLSKTKLKKLKNYIFDECKNLEKIILPESIETLEEYCLCNTKVKSINLLFPKEIKNLNTKITINNPTLDDLLKDKSFKELNAWYNENMYKER